MRPVEEPADGGVCTGKRVRTDSPIPSGLLTIPTDELVYVCGSQETYVNLSCELDEVVKMIAVSPDGFGRQPPGRTGLEKSIGQAL